MADKAVVHALTVAKTPERFGTVLTGKLADVAALLPGLEARALQLPNPSGWDEVGPGIGFDPISIPDGRALHLDAVS